jgi:hypothetical protein
MDAIGRYHNVRLDHLPLNVAVAVMRERRLEMETRHKRERLEIANSIIRFKYGTDGFTTDIHTQPKGSPRKQGKSVRFHKTCSITPDTE